MKVKSQQKTGGQLGGWASCSNEMIKVFFIVNEWKGNEKVTEYGD